MTNKVIAGDYKDKRVITVGGNAKISVGFSDTIDINKTSVDHYEVIDETSLTTGKKSAVSAVGRAFVGGALLGPAGLLAGVTAKTKLKNTRTILVAVQFNDGKQSLIQFDDKGYNHFLRAVFTEAPHPKAKKEKDQSTITKPDSKSNDTKSNNQVLKVLGWIFIPYIMTIAYWKKLTNPYRVIGIVWTLIIIIVGATQKR